MRKLEEKGFNAERAFKAFDEDEDEVLTINEIREGMKFHNVNLLDTEWKMLVDSMDENADGILTLEEWQHCLTPRIDAQKQFSLIMKDLNITDPLILEEQILDTLFNIRRLRKEVAVLRRTKGKE